RVRYIMRSLPARYRVRHRGAALVAVIVALVAIAGVAADYGQIVAKGNDTANIESVLVASSARRPEDKSTTDLRDLGTLSLRAATTTRQQDSSTISPVRAQPPQRVLNEYCAGCHNDRA